ncbi:MAG: hypothetical protein H0V77_05435 [Actinobacteria bacterium]|nr:hypothetical protein [Actinomycetota bacterium]
MNARFSRWDDSQTPFDEDIDVSEALDELSDDLLEGFGTEGALDNLRHSGISGRARGLDELRRMLLDKRRRAAEELNLSGPFEEVRQKLDEVLMLERQELARRLEDDARVAEAILDALPRAPAAALKELMGYDFASAEAQQRFQELLDGLKKEVLNSYFGRLAGGMRDLSPEDIERFKDMLSDLNTMIAARDRGDDYDFEGFMERYGDMFPDHPKTLDELLESLAQRMAAMSRLLASLSERQRSELAALAEQIMGDLDLAFQVDQLTRSLQEHMPDLPWNQEAPGWGEGEMPMSEAVDAIERLGEYEDLEQSLAGDYPGASLDDIDEEKLAEALGDDAVRDLGRLRAIEKALEEAGVLQRSGNRLELTARGARLLGERSLTKLLSRIRSEPTHRASGGQAEPTGQMRPWLFGDDDQISVERTVYNAVVRLGPGRALTLSPDDFEVKETESRPRTSTALLLDLSFSMPLNGHWVPAKKTALALHALIEGKYPDDTLHLVGFSDYARTLTPQTLATAGWENVHGTNMQHAFLLAHRLLSNDRSAVKQVIMVTDGEPTAHLDPDGSALFNWPPVPVTIERTLREAARLARSQIKINVFMLEETPGLVRFMDRLARLTGGQVFQAEAAGLGAAIVGGYGRRRA